MVLLQQFAAAPLVALLGPLDPPEGLDWSCFDFADKNMVLNQTQCTVTYRHRKQWDGRGKFTVHGPPARLEEALALATNLVRYKNNKGGSPHQCPAWAPPPPLPPVQAWPWPPHAAAYTPTFVNPPPPPPGFFAPPATEQPATPRQEQPRSNTAAGEAAQQQQKRPRRHSSADTQASSSSKQQQATPRQQAAAVPSNTAAARSSSSSCSSASAAAAEAAAATKTTPAPAQLAAPLPNAQLQPARPRKEEAAPAATAPAAAAKKAPKK